MFVLPPVQLNSILRPSSLVTKATHVNPIMLVHYIVVSLRHCDTMQVRRQKMKSDLMAVLLFVAILYSELNFMQQLLGAGSFRPFKLIANASREITLTNVHISSHKYYTVIDLWSYSWPDLVVFRL